MSWRFGNRTSEELPRERAGCPDQEGLGECSYLFMCLHADLISSWFSGLPQAAKRKRKVAILFEAKGILWFKNKSKLDSDFLLPSYSSISTWQSITVDANPVTGSISFSLTPARAPPASRNSFLILNQISTLRDSEKIVIKDKRKEDDCIGNYLPEQR